MSDSNILELFCLVLGDEGQNAFKIKIAKTDTVSDLKDAIKDKNPQWGNIAARTLVLWKVRESSGLTCITTDTCLWKVSIPFNRNLKQTVDEVQLHDQDALWPVDE